MPRSHRISSAEPRHPDAAAGAFTLRTAIRLGAPFLLLAGLAIGKLGVEPTPVGRSDQAFFFQIAQNVAEGSGLRTSVSLYEKGLRDLPAPTTVYPLWPLVLGYAGRVVGLERAAVLVPSLLFFVNLALLWLFARRLAREVGNVTLLSVRGIEVLDVGTAACALLGLNAVFFACTSEPWTEGLAFTLLFGSLLAVAHAPSRPLLLGGAAGLLAGLAYLTRSQLIGVPVALALALGWQGHRRAAGAALVAAVVPVLFWLAFLVSSVAYVTPRMLVDFTAYRESPVLGPFDGFSEAGGPGGFLVTLLEGLGVAFHPLHPQGYVASFGPVVYVIFLAPLPWLLHTWRARGRLARGRGSLCVAASLLAAAAALAPAHALHARYPYAWFFHWRHGLPIILAIVPAMAILAKQGPRSRHLVLVLVAVSLALSVQHVGRYLPARGSDISRDEVALAEWLDAHPEPPLLLSTQSRPLAALSHANAHWTRCELSPLRTRAHFAELGIDYLVLYRGELGCRFVRGLGDELELVRTFGSHIAVFRWREPAHPD